MKIATINFHFAHNFGAVLQSLALQKALENMGNSVDVIDYRPDYMVQQYKPFPNPIAGARRAARDYRDSKWGYRVYRELRRAAQYALNYRYAATRMKRQYMFDAFVKEHLNLSQRTYHTIQELRKDSPKADIYITGSDQVWNPYVTNADLEEAYFLDFGDEAIKRASYAVSPCQLDVRQYETRLKTYLGSFSHISLRESERQMELSRCLNREIEVCIDPTLLLTASDYRQYESEIDIAPGRYIVAYAFIDKKRANEVGNALAKLKKLTGLPVIDISLDTVGMPEGVRRIKALSPAGFLAYIKNAAMVVTNSFHGTAFSIVYHRRFLTIPKGGTSSRMDELLSRLGLSGCLLRDDIDIEKVARRDPDYTQADRLLQAERQHSMEFLRRVCLER